MNHKLYTAASQLSEEQRTANKGAFFKSVQETLQHIMVADLIWLRRFYAIPTLQTILSPLETYPAIEALDDILYPDFNELWKVRKNLDHLIKKFIATLSEEEMAETFTFKNMAGKSFSNSLWVYLLHMFNHQTHHRGQATTLLTQMSVDVGVTDFPYVLIEDLDNYEPRKI